MTPYPRYQVHYVAVDNRPGWVKTIIIDRATGQPVPGAPRPRADAICDFCNGNRAAGADKRSKTGLAPCPFCGSVNLSSISRRNAETGARLVILIQCNDCGATGPLGENEAQIRAAWDIRAKEE